MIVGGAEDIKTHPEKLLQNLRLGSSIRPTTFRSWIAVWTIIMEVHLKVSKCTIHFTDEPCEANKFRFAVDLLFECNE